MKTLRQIDIIVMIIVIVGGSILFISNKIFHRKPSKPVKIDVEKVGKTIGDIRREFLKGYHDTTRVKIDSTKNERNK